MFRRFSVRVQLTVLTAVVSLFTLLISFSVLIWWDSATFRDHLAKKKLADAEVIANNSRAAVAFGDAKAAEEILNTLRFRPDLEVAALYTKDGKMLASYVRTPEMRNMLPAAPKATSIGFKGDSLECGFLIRSGDELEGTLFMASSLGSWVQRRDAYIRLVCILALLALACAAVVGSKLHRSVSGPIQYLVQTMGRVSEEKNYSLRMEYSARNEIGYLVEGFNRMLAEIQARDAALHEANEELERRVRTRTEQLEEEARVRRRREEQLRISEKRLADFFDTAPMGIVRLDSDGTILASNRAELEMFGYASEEFVGKNILAFHLDETGIRELVEKLGQGPGQWGLEGSIRCRDGSVRQIEAILSSVWEDGKFLHGGLFTRDVTMLKKAEESEKAKERAERANQAKSEFLSRMSHELRTPMNSILGFGQLLEMEPMEPRQKESVQQIMRAGRHLLNLINEVLNISRIESGAISLSLEPVALSFVMKEAIDLITPMAVQKGLTIEDGTAELEHRYVRADRQRMSQVLINLLGNAVKYNVTDGKIVCTAEETADGRIRIGIADTGVGISPEAADRLFVPFDRLGAEQTDVEGTGFGLALTKTLVEAMSGQIWLDASYPGPGSRFYLEFKPAQENEEASTLEISATPTEQQEGSAQKTVLLIEDNLANVKLIEQLLASRPGVKLLVAMQGMLGYEFALEHHPDLILLDINLPDTNGYEVAKKLKQEARLARTPLLVISADATLPVRQKLQEIGVHGYLTKPIDVRMFIELIDQLFADEVRLSA
jgi:PAS domain S-box-containing protein